MNSDQGYITGPKRVEEIFPSQTPEILLSITAGKRRALQGGDLTPQDWADLVRDARLQDAQVEGADLLGEEVEQEISTAGTVHPRNPQKEPGAIRKDHPGAEKSFSEIVNDKDQP